MKENLYLIVQNIACTIENSFQSVVRYATRNKDQAELVAERMRAANPFEGNNYVFFEVLVVKVPMDKTIYKYTYPYSYNDDKIENEEP